MNKTNILLGVNIDHVATLRQARGTLYPEPVQAALAAEQAGADGITAHLREDRRHIQDRDIYLLKQMLHTRLNLEMAVTDEMVDIAVVLEDGSYHDVDSSEMAFKIAGSMAFKEACRRASPRLLEPIMRVEVVVPEDYMGPVISDLNSRRGQLQGRESRAGTEIINVQVPLAEMFGYATDIRSRTQGRGSFSMHFSHYQQAPPNISEEIVGKANGEKVKR